MKESSKQGREELFLMKNCSVWCTEGDIAARFAVGGAFREALLAVEQRTSQLQDVCR